MRGKWRLLSTYKTTKYVTVITNSRTREVYRKNMEDLLGVYYKIEIHVNPGKVIIKMGAM